MEPLKVERALKSIDAQKNEGVKFEIPATIDTEDSLPSGILLKLAQLPRNKKRTKAKASDSGAARKAAYPCVKYKTSQTPCIHIEQEPVELKELLQSLLESKDENVRAGLLEGLLKNENLKSDDFAGIFDVFSKDSSNKIKNLLFDNIDKFAPDGGDSPKVRLFLYSFLKEEKDPALRYQNLLKICKSKILTHKQKLGCAVLFFKNEKFQPSQYRVIKEVFNLIKEYQEKDGKDVSRILLAAALSPQKQIAMDSLEVLLNLKPLDTQKKSEILKIIMKYGYEPAVKQAMQYLVNSGSIDIDEFTKILTENKRKSYSKEEIKELLEGIKNISPDLSSFSSEFSSLRERETADASYNSLSDDEKRKIEKLIENSSDSFSEQIALSLHLKDSRENIGSNFKSLVDSIINIAPHAQSNLIKVMLLQDKGDIQKLVFENFTSFKFARKNLLPLLAIGFGSDSEDIELASAANLKKYNLSAGELAYLSFNLPEVRTQQFDEIIQDVVVKNIDKLKELPKDQRVRVVKNLFEKGNDSLQIELLNSLDNLDLSADDMAEIIKGALDDSNENVRLAAIDAVGNFHFSDDAQAVEVAKKLSMANGASEKIAVGSILENLFENCKNLGEVARDMIADFLVNSGCPGIRAKALSVISSLNLGKMTTLAIIRKTLEDGEINVRDAALFALKKLGVGLSDISDMIEKIAKGAPQELPAILDMPASDIIRASNNMAPAARKQIIDLFYDMEETRPFVFEVLGQLNLLPDEAEHYIMKGLKDPYTRIAAIRLLDDFSFCDESFAEILKEILTGAYPEDLRELSYILPFVFKKSTFFKPESPGGVFDTLFNSNSLQLIKAGFESIAELDVGKNQVSPYIEKHIASGDKTIIDAARKCYEKLKD